MGKASATAVTSTDAFYNGIIEHGLQGRAKPKTKVAVVGAGMAGLVAALTLLDAGYEVVVLEAQRRVGGRIQTLREGFSDGLYAEAGAMRIPTSHKLTIAYIEKFIGKYELEPIKLPRNAGSAAQERSLKKARTEAFDSIVRPFRAEQPRDYYFIAGDRLPATDESPTLASLKLGLSYNDDEKDKTISDLWDEAIRPITDLLEEMAKKGDDGSEELKKTYDQYSTRAYLEKVALWSRGAIEAFAISQNQEGLMESSFLEMFREEVGHYYKDPYRIKGGMDRLPNWFLKSLSNNIMFDAKVVAIEQFPGGVSIYYTTSDRRIYPLIPEPEYVILAIPFPVLRYIDMRNKPFSYRKQLAIRQLHYDSATKIFLQCKRRFWETDGSDIRGASTITDLPIKAIYYPNEVECTDRGILLASYTWGEDAIIWGAMSEEERVTRAIEYVSRIHPNIRKECEGGVSKVWHKDEFARGAYALFMPGQHNRLHDDIVASEGRIHFAGEHTSLFHAWIQGAIESGLRAAHEIHTECLAADGIIV